MTIFSLYFCAISALLFANNANIFKTDNKESFDFDFSSKIDPEECYSAGKAFGDVGVFPNRQYRGNGIKIGIIDDGIPANLQDYNLGGIYGNSTVHEHCHNVASVLCGSSGIASEATVYFASRYGSDYSFEQCLRHLVEVEQVDVINHSMGYGNDPGYYNYYYSGLVDEYIKSHNVIFVNSFGNYNQSPSVPSISLAINVISVGSNDKDLSYSSLNSQTIKCDYDSLIDCPNLLSPGNGLFGFNTQSLNTSDANIDLESFCGTSFSAPIVTGIIALLLEEFPSLKGHPESIMSILNGSKKNGVVNYQLARQVAQNLENYTINANSLNNDLLKTVNIILPLNKKISVSNFILFNGVYNHNPDASFVYLNEITFSKVKIKLERANGECVYEITSTKSNISFEYENSTIYDSSFVLKVFLFGSKSPNGAEKACISYRINSFEQCFVLSYANMHLDTLPSFQWEIYSPFNSNNVSLIFYNFKNQIILQKNNLPVQGSLVLSISEWHNLLDLRGREFYVYLSATSISNQMFCSAIHVLNEPKTFAFLSNINPVNFGFPDAYNNSVLINSMQVDNVGLTIERLRCGYIQQQYINLSSKKAGTGHAYLQIEFDTEIAYCAFGVTLWRDHELTSYDGDTAVVEVKNGNGNWIELIDLLEDITLPNSRKDVLRFETYSIFGIRFDITSTQISDRNKGRLCIDNISFTEDITFSNFLSSFTEPIVIREDFSLPNA